MARCRIGYLLALLGAVAFFVCFSGYFSFYVLVLALVFPLFSLLVSLPGMLGAGVSFAASHKAMRRGESALLTLALTSRWRLPVGRFSCRIVCANLMSGDVLRFRKHGAGGSLGLELKAEVESHHCGLVRCEASKIKVYDLLGIFSRRLPPSQSVSILTLPLDLPPEAVPALLGEGEDAPVLKPRPGGGPGEDYDLRPYRPGDPLRSVHWKLSSKMDGLIVRETMEPVKVSAVLTYDHWGEPGELDAVLDRLDAISRALIERERPHHIQWADPATGLVHSQAVSSQQDLRAFEYTAFSLPAPKAGASVAVPRPPDGAGLVRHLHVTAADADEGGETL